MRTYLRVEDGSVEAQPIHHPDSTIPANLQYCSTSIPGFIGMIVGGSFVGLLVIMCALSAVFKYGRRVTYKYIQLKTIASNDKHKDNQAYRCIYT
jgi:hypothetical protein